MGGFLKDMSEILNKINHFLSLNDALITPEGRAFLNDKQKMENFYNKLKEEKKNNNKEKKETETN